MLETFKISGGELKLLKILQSKKGTFKKNGHRKRLNKDEIQEIIKLYPDHFNWQLERMFNISQSNLLKIRKRYNLHKSDEIMRQCRYSKGSIPFNKGKSYPLKNSGQFQKGHIPKNHRPIGSIRINNGRKDSYLYIKIAEPNKWNQLHRQIWEQKIGEIPEGNIIIFKDGNKMNYEMSNLEMISRKQNMERNRNRKKASESMKEIWRKEKMRAKYGLQRQTKLRIK